MKPLGIGLMLSLSFLIADLVDYNLELLSVIEFDNDNNNYGVSDVWGYTDEYGNEYAIVGYRDGTAIYDVSTTPNNPIEIINIPGPSNGDYYYHRDYKTYGDYLYIVNEMTGPDVGMQVIDLSPLPFSNPEQIESYANVSQSHNLWIDDSGYAFIEHHSGDNIHIADLSDPAAPSYGGSFGNMANYCHDVYTRDNIAYVSEGWAYQFGIYDVENLNAITQLATISTPDMGYAHNAWPNDAGTHLITTEETVDKTIKIWDISNLNDIYVAGEYLGENALAHNVHVKNDLVYISHYSVGIKIIDVFDPSDPIEVAAYDTYPQDNGSGYVGCWGAYPFASSNMIYASDMQNGLHIFNFEPRYAGWVNGYIYYSANTPAQNVTLKSMLNNKNFYSDDSGYYDFGFPDGIHDFEVYYQNELIDTVQIEVFPRETVSQDIMMGDVLLGDVNQDEELNILDVIVLIGFVLGTQEPSEQQLLISDMNDDGMINVQDIILLVNEILNRNA